MKSIIDELGYSGVRVALTSDIAKELVRLRTEIAARRSAPSVPLESPGAESKCNGAIEKAVRTWQGQFRTLKDDLEYEIGEELGPRSTVWTWCAWWAAGLLNRVKVTTTGRTPYELYTGHKSRTPVAAFGERILWRQPRARSGAGKFDSEWDDGVFLGISGVEVLIGTSSGVHRSRDIRRRLEGECWGKESITQRKVSFREYICPEDGPQADFEIPVVHREAGDIPDIDFTTKARRMMLHPRDFQTHGFTAGCPGCIQQQAGTQQRGGRHTEKCRERIEKELGKTPEGRQRKERERLRQQQEFDKMVSEEDQKQQARAEQDRRQEAPGPPAPLLPRRLFAENDPSRPSDPIALGRYLNSQFVNISLGLGIHPSDEAFGPLNERYQQERDQLIADATARHGEDPPHPPEDDDEPERKRARQEEALRIEDARIIAMLARGCDVMEVFSPERVGRVCKEFGLVPGPALDLQTGYNFSRHADRKKAIDLINSEEPELVTLSPPCTEFSRLQALNRHIHGEEYEEEHDRMKAEAVKHVEF